MTGGCLCGAIRYRAEGASRRTTHCHCQHCRRSSGAPFVTWSEFAAPGFVFVNGTPASYASRPGVTRQFCAACGTQLTYRNADTPGSVDVTACSLDEAAGVVPEDHVWCDRMLPWIRLADGLPRHRLGRNDG